MKVKVADDGSLWWPKAKAVDASESLWSGDTKTEKVAEGTGVKHPLVTPGLAKEESPATDPYHELQRLDEDEKEGSPTNDMGEIKQEDCSGFWHTGKPEREASLGWSADQEKALKEISQIIKEQAHHDEMRKNASEDRSGSPQSLSHEAGGAVGSTCPQDDLIHFQEFDCSPPVKKQEPVPTRHPLVTDQARNGGISQPTEEDCRRGLGDIKTELDQRDQYLMGKMRANFYDMLEEHQWKTTNTLTKLGGKVGDLGGKVIQLSQAVEETRERMDKTLEAVQVALREITGIKDKWQHGSFRKKRRESRRSRGHP